MTWQLDAVHLEELAVLLGERVLRLGEHPNQRLLVEVVDRGDHGEPADELGDEPEADEVLGHHLGDDLARHGPSSAERTSAPKPTDVLPIRLLITLFEPGEGSAADEQHVGGVDLEELLVGMLAAALGRHGGDRALEDLQQRLLDALAGDVPGDRGVLGLAGDLVDLVDVDDPGLGALDVEVGGLDQLEEDVLDVLADVAGLGERRGVGDGERHVEHAVPGSAP